MPSRTSSPRRCSTPRRRRGRVEDGVPAVEATAGAYPLFDTRSIGRVRFVAMKILLLGATGRTGRHVLEQAVAAGHDVSVLVRSPDRLPPGVGVRTAIGSALDPGDVGEAVRGMDAVLVTLGNRRAREVFGSTLMTRAMQALVPSMGR